MRTLAIGDIHGCSVALHALLDAVAPQPDDVLISLGDVIDRGPDSRGVLDFLIDLYAGGRLVVLRGNHEQMMLDARGLPDAWLMWLACGGRQAVASYPNIIGDTFEPSKIPEAHWKFLDENLLDCCETATHWRLGGAGVVLAQPLPADVALDPDAFTVALGRAHALARESGVRGAALTPFLLARLAELTDGRTLRANRALIVANARLAARVALALARGGTHAHAGDR